MFSQAMFWDLTPPPFFAIVMSFANLKQISDMLFLKSKKCTRISILYVPNQLPSCQEKTGQNPLFLTNSVGFGTSVKTEGPVSNESKQAPMKIVNPYFSTESGLMRNTLIQRDIVKADYTRTAGGGGITLCS